MQALRHAGASSAFYDWGGGLIWAVMPTAADLQVHGIAANGGGHARVLRSGVEADRAADVFGPLPPPQRKLHEQLKQAFDPSGILNPGRMYAGV
jgi:glycolate oxidase FAD binding subunit